MARSCQWFVPHEIIKIAMNFFWIANDVEWMLMNYCGKFRMRFLIGGFITEWQRLEIGIAAWCTVSVVLFVLVMEMLLRPTNCEEADTKTSLRAFMDDIAVVTYKRKATDSTLDWLNTLIEWTRRKFKAKKSWSVAFVKGVPKEGKFWTAAEEIPAVKEQPIKRLGRWNRDVLNDKEKDDETHKLVEKGLKPIDKTTLQWKFTWFILQFGLYSRIMWLYCKRKK